MVSIAAWLRAQGAQNDVIEWAEPFGEDWATAWDRCPRGDWLLGVAARAGAERHAIVRAAAACARLALDHLPEDEPRPLAAIEAAERWAAGDDLPAARERARAGVEAAAESAPDPAVQAAAMAALAALVAVDAPEEAAGAAACVAQAAVFDAGDCAMMSALGYAHATCADRVRTHIPLDALPLELAAAP